jgi:stearoyl-CoA desaturase (delta-9 desaturase)
MGWLLHDADAPAQTYAKELVEDPFMHRVGRWYWLIALMSLFGTPGLLGWLINGGSSGVLIGIAWIGLVRSCFLLQFTFCINSVCHVFGKRTFVTDDQSRDVWWLRLATMGESNHNGHHAFPRSFRHGLKGGLDPSAILILALNRVGLARELYRVSPDNIKIKLNPTT